MMTYIPENYKTINKFSEIRMQILKRIKLFGVFTLIGYCITIFIYFLGIIPNANRVSSKSKYLIRHLFEFTYMYILVSIAVFMILALIAYIIMSNKMILYYIKYVIPEFMEKTFYNAKDECIPKIIPQMEDSNLFDPTISKLFSKVKKKNYIVHKGSNTIQASYFLLDNILSIYFLYNCTIKSDKFNKIALNNNLNLLISQFTLAKRQSRSIELTSSGVFVTIKSRISLKNKLLITTDFKDIIKFDTEIEKYKKVNMWNIPETVMTKYKYGNYFFWSSNNSIEERVLLDDVMKTIHRYFELKRACNIYKNQKSHKNFFLEKNHIIKILLKEDNIYFILDRILTQNKFYPNENYVQNLYDDIEFILEILKTINRNLN